MEPERRRTVIKLRKRGADATDSREERRADNPFYIESGTGRVRVDLRVLEAPQNQELLRALFEHFQRGSNATLPFEVFPVRQVPEDLLLQLVDGDVRTFVRLAGSDPQMRARLLPLTPRFVCQVWPDVALLLSLACDVNLMHQLTELNEASPREFGGRLMGFGNMDDKRGRLLNLQNECRDAVRDADIARLSTFFRGRGKDGRYTPWELYRDVSSYRDSIEPSFRLPMASACHFSCIASIRLVVELLLIDERLRLFWRRRDVAWKNARKGFRKLEDILVMGTLLVDYDYFDEDESEVDGDALVGLISRRTYSSVRRFAMELSDALSGQTKEDAWYEFSGNTSTDDAEGFSVDAAHLRTLIERHDAEANALLEQRGTDDPLYTTLIPVDRLANEVCLMAGADDCGSFWFRIMRQFWLGLQGREPQPERESSSDDDTSGYSTDAPYRCAACRTTATRFDKAFGLPFCAQQQCLGDTFAKLRAHGLCGH